MCASRRIVLFFFCNSLWSFGLKEIKAKKISVANSLRGIRHVYFKTAAAYPPLQERLMAKSRSAALTPN